MPSAKLVIGGAAATAALGVRVARSLYDRWHMLPEPERRRIESLAEDLKHKALELRGAADAERAKDGLRAANASLAAALVESAERDPDLAESEVRELREELRRELDRLEGTAEMDIKAWRTARKPAPRYGPSAFP
jgi:Pyruvate/2-oxoacid:ferredoxin oxidoreductase gamma subunit